MKSRENGICRRRGKENSSMTADTQQEVATSFSCEQWEDCGQQYYIRLGWIKGQGNKEETS